MIGASGRALVNSTTILITDDNKTLIKIGLACGEQSFSGARMYLTTSNALAGFQEVVSSLGGEPAVLLEVFRFKAEDLESPSKLLPMGNVIELFNSASRRGACRYSPRVVAAKKSLLHAFQSSRIRSA